MAFMDTRYGQVELGMVEVSYWSEYPSSGDNKTMYFKPLNVSELKPVKGLRRNIRGGYYTCRVSTPNQALKDIKEVYNN